MPTLTQPRSSLTGTPVYDITRRELIAGAAAALVVAGCGDDGAGDPTTPATSGPATTPGPAPSSTDGATTTTPRPTERFAALDPRTLDILVALNVDVVAAQSGGDSLGVPAYVERRATGPIEIVGNGGELYFESLAAVRPDRMIGISDVEEQRSLLEGIAPLATYDSALYADGGARDWRADILAVGALAGVGEQAEGLVAMLEARFAQTRAAIDRRQGTGTAIMRAYGAEGYRWYVPGSIPLVIADEIGLVTAAMPFTPDAGRYVVDFAVERVLEVNADHVFVSIGNFGDLGSDDEFAALAADPLWSTVPAVAEGNVARIADVSAWFIGGPLGWQVMLEEIETYFAG